MPKKNNPPRVEKVFSSLRKKLPRRYMADLCKLLPDLDSKKIFYAMESRCQDIELKEKSRKR